MSNTRPPTCQKQYPAATDFCSWEILHLTHPTPTRIHKSGIQNMILVLPGKEFSEAAAILDLVIPRLNRKMAFARWLVTFLHTWDNRNGEKFSHEVRKKCVIISFKVQIAQIQLPPGVREKLQQQLAKLPPEQQELFKKHQPQVLLRLQQQLMKQQQGGTPSTGITKIPITVNVRSPVIDCGHQIIYHV